MTNFRKLIYGLEKKYIFFTILAPLTMMGEVAMEVLIPLLMAKIVDVGITSHNIQYVVRTGLLMIGAACLSLTFGILSGRFAALASTGFSHNLRRNLFGKVQDLAFSNMDKFGTASLVTRLTSDVTNAQNTYQMVIRICVRSPAMLVFAVIMSFNIDRELASFLLIATTPIDTLCAALRRLHVPDILVTLLLLTYRYIGVMLEEVVIMSEAYSLRAPGQKGIHISAWGSFLGQLLLRSMDRAEALYHSMLLRGFRGEYYYAEVPKCGVTGVIFTVSCCLAFLCARWVDLPVLLGSLFVR